MKNSILLTIFSLSLLTGCGFRLAGTEDIANNFNELIFVGDNNDIFYKEIDRNLTLKGVHITEGGTDLNSHLDGDTPVLSCSPLKSESKALSVSSDSQVLEYSYLNSIACILYIKGKKPYAMNNRMDRSYLNKLGATLAQNTEENVIRSEAAAIMADQIIFRIQHAGLEPQKTDSEGQEENSNNSVTVIFNPTGGTTADEQTEVYTIENAEELKHLEELKKENISGVENRH